MNHMFKLNVMVTNKMNEAVTSYTYMLEFSNVWKGHLGHVNCNSIRHLVKLIYIPKFDIDLITNVPYVLKPNLPDHLSKRLKETMNLMI